MTKTKPSYKVLIDLTAPKTHRARITIESAAENIPGLLQFPVWTPGSYLVREYSRHITRLDPADKIAKNRWQLRGTPSKVTYEVYAFERTVRTSFVDENYITLVGATLLPLLHAPFEVEIRLPKHWQMLSSALKFRKRGPGRWTALVNDDDQWIDCPIVAAAPGFGKTSSFRCKGITHHIAWVGLNCEREMKDFESAFRKIAETTIDFFGGAPFKEYWFLLHFGHKIYGGLEHRDSQLSQFDGGVLGDKKKWEDFLRLIAHEYLHAWNVKSLRPFALGPFNYEAENYTQDIWFAEGLTDYFDDMLVWKAGLIDDKAYWTERLQDSNELPDGNPGHLRRSIAESSFDAWIRYYRPDEDSVNTDVSYYSKGATLGWCWDAYLTKRSKGKWTLAKLMRAYWKEFGIDAYEPLKHAKPGYTRDDLYRFAEEKTKIPHRALLENWITGRRPLPWKEAAKTFGLKISPKTKDAFLHFTGMQLQFKPGATAQKVLSGSAAEAGGLAPNDEILAVEGIRVSDSEKFNLALAKRFTRGGSVKLLVCRLDKILEKIIRPRSHAETGIEYVLEKF
ncbi:MAG: M61 family metallopeptidase [Bacteriovoracia bacterium]